MVFELSFSRANNFDDESAKHYFDIFLRLQKQKDKRN